MLSYTMDLGGANSIVIRKEKDEEKKTKGKGMITTMNCLTSTAHWIAKWYVGDVFHSDQFTKEESYKKPLFVLVNSDLSTKNDHHWMLFCNPFGTMEYFNSLGVVLNDYIPDL